MIFCQNGFGCPLTGYLGSKSFPFGTLFEAPSTHSYWPTNKYFHQHHFVKKILDRI